MLLPLVAIAARSIAPASTRFVPTIRGVRLKAALSLEFPPAQPAWKFNFSLCLRNRSQRPIPVDEFLSDGQTVEFELRGADHRPLRIHRPRGCSPLMPLGGAENDLPPKAERRQTYRWLDSFGLPQRPTVLYIRAWYRSRDYRKPGVVPEHYVPPSNWYRLEFTGDAWNGTFRSQFP